MEYRRFNKEWELQYFLTDVGPIAVCLIRGDTISVFKVFTLKMPLYFKI
jgi:hypothetical protein